MPGPSRHSVTCGSLKILCGRERSFDAANQGTVAFNRQLIEIAQQNINSSFDLAKSLLGKEVMELQAAYWRKQLSTITAQAEELRALSNRITADVAEPITTLARSSP